MAAACTTPASAPPTRMPVVPFVPLLALAVALLETDEALHEATEETPSYTEKYATAASVFLPIKPNECL